MPLFKPRTRGKQMVRHGTRLDRETNETLYAYAHFIGEPTEYVINQMIDTLLAKVKEFLQWRASRPESYAPRRPGMRDHPAKSADHAAWRRRSWPVVSRAGCVPMRQVG